jgi:hypothetical protein
MILLADQLLTPEERLELYKMIFEVEKMVLETHMVQEETDDGESVWVEKVKGELSLYDVEMCMESLADYYAYFEREDGTTVTKFDVERKLNGIKRWLYDKVRQRSQGRRFNKFR